MPRQRSVVTVIRDLVQQEVSSAIRSLLGSVSSNKPKLTDTEPPELHWVWEGWKDRDHDPRHTRQLQPRGVSREARS